MCQADFCIVRPGDGTGPDLFGDGCFTAQLSGLSPPRAPGIEPQALSHGQGGGGGHRRAPVSHHRPQQGQLHRTGKGAPWSSERLCLEEREGSQVALCESHAVKQAASHKPSSSVLKPNLSPVETR